MNYRKPLISYGGSWWHEFSSSGGGLDHIKISEKIRPESIKMFGTMREIDPGGANVWNLDAEGWMRDQDYYITMRSNIIIEDILYEYPNAQFPLESSDLQWYYFKCECDNKWVEFTGPERITVSVQQMNGLTFVRTSAYGKSTEEKYNPEQ